VIPLASEGRPLTRQELCAIKKKNNRPGVSGVTRIDVQERRRGQLYRRIYWKFNAPLAMERPGTRSLRLRSMVNEARFAGRDQAFAYSSYSS
jgi:hypothetical protein